MLIIFVANTDQYLSWSADGLIGVRGRHGRTMNRPLAEVGHQTDNAIRPWVRLLPGRQFKLWRVEHLTKTFKENRGGVILSVLSIPWFAIRLKRYRHVIAGWHRLLY